VELGRVARFSLTLAELVAGLIILFYLASARGLGIVTGALMAALVYAGRMLPAAAGAALFFGGWSVQFFGHAVYEKRSPAFTKNLLHLLVGPAWLVGRALRRVSPAG
jgi:uncharacterized membrane protein YGL010W